MPPLITSRTESLGQPHHEPLSDASARSRGLAGAPGKVVLLTTAEEAQSRLPLLGSQLGLDLLDAECCAHLDERNERCALKLAPSAATQRGNIEATQDDPPSDDPYPGPLRIHRAMALAPMVT